MPQATVELASGHLQLEPFDFRFVTDNTVEVSMKRAEGGNPIVFMMGVSALAKLVDMSVAMMNRKCAERLLDLGIFD
jgi:hypothetical protein